MLSLNLCFYGLKPDPEKHDWPADLDKPYNVKAKFTELVGGQLLTGDNQHPAIVLGNGQAIRLAAVELRGDWKWHREVLNLSCGWNSTYLCHHCLSKKSNYLQFPNPELKQRRHHGSFISQCKPDPAGDISA